MLPGMNGEHRAKIKHGHYVGNKSSPEYNSWRSIKARCLNTSHQRYPLYGGSGVIMYPKWVHDFKLFLHDVGPRPSHAHTLDRIKNDQGYVPGNVRWAISRAQNRKGNHLITVNEKTLCLEDWARQLGCSPNAIRNRHKRGWSWEKAVTTPVNVKLQNNTKSNAEVSEFPIAFGPNDITIVMSGNQGKFKLFVGRRQIGCIYDINLKANVTKQVVPHLTISLPGLVDTIASEQLRINVSTYIGLLKQFG